MSNFVRSAPDVASLSEKLSAQEYRPRLQATWPVKCRRVDRIMRLLDATIFKRRKGMGELVAHKLSVQPS